MSHLQEPAAVGSTSVCRAAEEVRIAAGCKQPLAKKAENKSLALPRGSLRDKADVATDEAAVSVGRNIRVIATVAKEGTGGTASTEAHEPAQSASLGIGPRSNSK